MHYEINVAKDGRHFFATAERSITNKADAKKLLTHFILAFPVDHGFTVTITEIKKVGR